MQLFARRTLLWKYAAYFAGLVSVLLAASGAISGYFAYRGSVAALAEVQGATAHYAAKEIANFIRGVQDAMHISVGKFGTSANIDTGDLQLELVALFRHHPEISELRWITAAGKEQLFLSRFGFNVPDSGRDWSADPSFEKEHQSTDYVGRVHFLQGTEPYVVVAVTREAMGSVLEAEVNLKYVWDVIAQAHLKSGGVAYVVDREGQLISHPDISLVLSKSNLSALAHVRRVLDGGTQTSAFIGEAFDVHGTPVVSIAAPVPEMGWTVFAEQSLAEAFRPVYASVGRSVALVLLGIVAAIATIVLLARRMVRPIREIETRARQLGSGQLDQRIALRTGDELDGLATQFNRMAERLQETHSNQETRIAERTHDLAVANEAKTRFLAAASHDLRQPIHALSLFVGELRTVALPPEASVLVERIEQSAGALADLLDGLLDLSKLDVGAIHADPQPLALQPLLSRLASQFALAAQAKGLALTQVRTSAWVRSDPLLLERILLNLIANAVRYTRKGRIVIGCRRRNGEVAVVVADTGVGIEAEHLPRVFQEFYRAGATDRGTGEGMTGGLGLGLAIVKRLALLLGHRIEIESLPGKGTLVRVWMPCVNAPANAEAETDDKAPRASIVDSLRGKCVLVIDDEEPVREAMRGLLTRWHCDVMAAANGDVALAHARLRRPDIVLCDLDLQQGETGVQIVEKLQIELGPRLACAFVTGEASPALMAAARATGCPVMLKPAPAGKLRALLEHLAQSDSGAPVIESICQLAAAASARF